MDFPLVSNLLPYCPPLFISLNSNFNTSLKLGIAQVSPTIFSEHILTTTKTNTISFDFGHDSNNNAYIDVYVDDTTKIGSITQALTRDFDNGGNRIHGIGFDGKPFLWVDGSKHHFSFDD